MKQENKNMKTPRVIFITCLCVLAIGTRAKADGDPPVPEPSTLPLLLAGFAAIVVAGLKSGKGLRVDS
jgi:hypothetical protein